MPSTVPLIFRFSVVGGLALLGLAPAASSPPSLPDSPAGQQARALLDALADGRPETLTRFAAEHFAARVLAERSAEERAKGLARVSHDLGAGTLEEVEAPSPNTLTLRLRAASGELWLEFNLEVDAAAPHGLLSLRIRADQQPPAEASGPPLSEREALAAIETAATERAKKDEFAGVVLVAHDGAIRLERALGAADRSFGTPVGTSTRFNLGSIYKIFTEVMVRQLVGEGKLRLDERLNEALPDYPNPTITAAVTIQQLLDHSSGLGDFFGDRFTALPKDRLRRLADYLPLFADQPLLFAPGSEHRYSNAGYIVLGLVIEHLTGSTYEDALKERVFGPAGMTASGLFADDEIVPQRATGYTHRSGASSSLVRNEYTLPARGSSAGGGYSTAEDLLRFAGALRGGRLLRADLWPSRGGIAIAGGSPGCNAALEDDWGSGWTVVVLSNLDPPSAESLAQAARGLLGRLRDEPRGAPHH